MAKKRTKRRGIVVRPGASPGLEILVNGPEVTMRDVRADVVAATCEVVTQAREQIAEAGRAIGKAGE